MHRSYAIQDGCHNCGKVWTIITIAIARGFSSHFCADEPGHIPACDDFSSRFLEWANGREVCGMGKCDKWKAPK